MNAFYGPPDRRRATPTGRAQTEESFTTKPVMKSSYSPVGTPSFRRARITTPLPLQRGPLGMPNPYKGGAEQKPA
jgi:hypothetical protein